MKVDRYNYPNQFMAGVEPLLQEIRRCLEQGHYVLSKEVAQFEAAFAQAMGTTYAKGVNSGTDAIAVALAALGVEPGDEVITQANTFNATINGIRLAGAQPVLVDADAETYLMATEQVASAITTRTRALMPVHLFGKPTPMQELLELSAKFNIPIIEDAAQAHGATWRGRRVGSIGLAGCFSFHPSKNLAAAGDAGAVVTSSHDLMAAVEEVRALGQRTQNQHVRPGFNTKLDSLQSLVLLAKLPYLDQWNDSRRRVAMRYRESLVGLPLGMQSESSDETHVYHLLQVRVRERDALLSYLVAHGVDSVVRYPTPVHLQPAFSMYDWRPGQFPVAEVLCRETLCLPMRPDLSDIEVDYVVEQVCNFFRQGLLPSNDD